MPQQVTLVRPLHQTLAELLQQILSGAEAGRAIYERVLAVAGAVTVAPGPNDAVPAPPAGYVLLQGPTGAYVRDADGQYLALPEGGAGTLPPVAHTHPISAVTGLQSALDGKAATTHTHGIAGVTGLQGALDGKAAATHGHGIAEVTGLQAALDGKAATSSIPTTEFLQDLVAAMFQAGTHSNASITYDDNAGTLNITAIGGTGGGSSLSQEEVEDFVGRLVVQGTGIAVTYDDAGNVLRIALSGESFTTAEKNKLAAIAAGATANASDAHLLARGNHTGTQAIATIAGLQAVIDDLTARIVALEAGTVVTPPPGPQPDPSPYQPDMTTGRIAPITTSFGGRPNVIPFTYFADGQDEMASMAMGA